MISSSNEQVQQELEFTLLKPDCHSWCISKMQSEREDTLEEQYAIRFSFKLGKNDATETYGMLQTAFGASCMNCASVFEWHKRFKGGRESVSDGEGCGRSKDTPVHNSILVTDYLTKMGIKIVPQPPYSPDLVLCDFCLLPKLRCCRYETFENMKEAVMKIIDPLTHEDFQRLLELYKCISARGDYLEGD